MSRPSTPQDASSLAHALRERLLLTTVRAMLVVGLIFNLLVTLATIYPVWITHQSTLMAFVMHVLSGVVTLGLGFVLQRYSAKLALYGMLTSGCLFLYGQIWITHKPEIYGVIIPMLILPALVLVPRLIITIMALYTLGFILLIQVFPAVTDGKNWWVIIVTTWSVILVVLILGRALQQILHDYEQTALAYQHEQQVREQQQAVLNAEREAREFINLYNHELGGMLSGAQALLALSDSADSATLTVLNSSMHQIEATVREVGLLTRTGTLSPYQLLDSDLAELIRTCAHELQIQQPHIQLVIQAPPIRLAIEPTLVRLSIETALRNAVEAIQHQASQAITITLSRQQEYAVIEIHDNGAGFEAQFLSTMNDHLNREHGLPHGYFSTKRGGTGRGLPLMAKVAALHNGYLALANHPNGGAWVKLGLKIEISCPQAEAQG